jgi:multidrug efflux pump subunit AcrA (membrane-fusion protein)
MGPRAKTWIKRLLVLPPVIAGAAFLVLQVAGRSEPGQSEPAEVSHPVRVVVVQPGDYVPRALGYGYVEPGSVWQAVAQVAGRIVYRHPELERGRVLEKDTVILRIDPTDYELAVARIRAGLESVAAQLAELETRAANLRASREIERRALVLAEDDLARKRTLLARDTASQAAVDQAESALLAQRQRVQDLENQLELIPAERRVLDADQALRQAELTEAELDLERTEIRLPFAARVAEVTAEIEEFVSVGQSLAVADSIDVAEVSAQLAIDHVRPLVETGIDLGSLTPQDLSVAPRRWGLTAMLRLRSGDFVATWEARFDRVGETVDPRTRTIGFIVAVDDPYGKIIPGKRPPLVKNMYVEVELRGTPRTARIIVPRVALNRDASGRPVVYVADANDRLEIRAVTPGPAQGDFTVIEDGLVAGERVVVSDLVPAIEGMLLSSRDDESLSERILRQAAGEAAVR